MMCAMRWGVFLFFAAWIAVMTVFVHFLLPGARRAGLGAATVPLRSTQAGVRWHAPSAVAATLAPLVAPGAHVVSHRRMPPPFPAETKGVPVEAVPGLFARHKVWGKVMGEAGEQFIRKDDAKAASYAAGQLEQQ